MKTQMKTEILMAMSLIFALTMIGCGDKGKSPPDDDLISHTVGAKASSGGCDKSFMDCAALVLSNSGLSNSEKESLSACDFDLAQATSSSKDVFEVSKQAVKHSCQ
jgi:predicted small lipoprotein YifL